MDKLELKEQAPTLLDCEWHRKEASHIKLWLKMATREQYVRQLLKCKIIKKGDRNGNFFHLLATIRR